ncbi:hypothetical protein G6F31_018689 [Rhizopus arrhizus]|nr:hypothetical protein G6F31_018689 [Rhizopus arrhizus]
MEIEALAATRELSSADTQVSGMLRVSCSDWFGSLLLAPVIAEFSGRYPGVPLELLTDPRLYSLPHREADCKAAADRVRVVRPARAMERSCRRWPRLPAHTDGYRLRQAARRGLGHRPAARCNHRCAQQQPRNAGQAMRAWRRTGGAAAASG